MSTYDPQSKDRKFDTLATGTFKMGSAGATPASQQSHVGDPAAMASTTQDSLTDNSGGSSGTTLAAITAGSDIDTTNMDDGSANDTLIAIGDTSSDNESSNIEKNFDKIADEVNVTNTAVSSIADAVASLAAQLAKIKTDVGAGKTAIDANNSAIDSILSTLETFGFHATS